MEQMYMVEIFVDKVTVFVTDEGSSADKNLIIKIKFGPKSEFIIKEGQLIPQDDDKKDDTIEVTETGRKQFTRTIRVGKSYLFPSYPDTIIQTLSQFPLEIEVWNDDANESDHQLFVGVGTMVWHTEFFHYLKETMAAFKLHQPLTIKEVTTLYQECCCGQAGEVTFILRLSALGDSIITEFQQQMENPDLFCFRTNKAPSMFECKRIEGDDPNFCMLGSLYETATLEDPELTGNAQKKIEICTELKSCGLTGAGKEAVCDHSAEPRKKLYAISKVRMGDIVGPCGNSNCPLAHKIKTYIRNLDAYKKKVGKLPDKPTDAPRKICGACICKDDRWHREDCPEKTKPDEATCSGCGGTTKLGNTCFDKKNKHFDTGTTPKPSSPSETPKSNKILSQYIYKVPDFKDAVFRHDFIVQDYFKSMYSIQEDDVPDGATTSKIDTVAICGQAACCKIRDSSNVKATASKVSPRTVGLNPLVYTAESRTNNKLEVPVYNFCTNIPDDKDCKCNPPKPSPPCKTFDCNCIAETANIASRKSHRSYCPLYRHKNNCPVTRRQEDEEIKKEDEEDESEPLPYGLPPVQLGPCPVMGRPCSVPDGFARMYKTAVMANQPPSYSDAGKMCCSKEYHRIKKAIKDYMQSKKDHDMRCINTFNVDTEKRCCDNEVILKSLMGRECCGAHKLALQEKSKEEKSLKP